MSAKGLPFGTRSALKQILIAESELNRVRLSQDWQALMQSSRHPMKQAKGLAIMVGAAALVIGAARAWRRSPAKGMKPSLLQKIIKGARMISTFWFAFRPNADSMDR